MAEGNSTPEQYHTKGLRNFINRAKEIKQIRGRGIKDAVLRTAREKSEKRAEEAEKNSMYDALTGLRSRRWLDERVSDAIRESARTGKSFYLKLDDLDDFKAYNSRFGHTGGDAILKLLSRIPTRPNEEIARYGGDEFVQVLNDDIEIDEAVKVAARSSEIVVSESEELIPTLPISDQNTPEVNRTTMTTGLIQYRPGMSLENLYQEASEMMLGAKKLGKDLITVKNSANEVKYYDRTGELVNPTIQPTQAII